MLKIKKLILLSKYKYLEIINKKNYKFNFTRIIKIKYKLQMQFIKKKKKILYIYFYKTEFNFH